MNTIKKLLKEKSKAISQSQFKEAAEICNAIGNEYQNQERYEEALEHHIEELQYCEMTDDQLSIAIAIRKIGECYAFLSKFEMALEYIQKYYNIALSINSVVEQQRAHSTFGRTYYLKYQHEIAFGTNDPVSETLDLALLEYCKAFKLLHELAPDTKPIELAEMKCRLLLNMGLVLENRKDHKESSAKVNEGLDIAIKYQLHEDIQRCGLVLGSMYHKQDNYVEANKTFEVAITAARKLNNKNMMCEILLAKGINLMSQENYNGAKKCLKSAFKLRTSNDEDHEKIAKALKVCIGVINAKNKFKQSQNCADQKVLLEKIADGLSAIGCFKLAIKNYLLTLEYMEDANATILEMAPIYFSLAKSYSDDDNFSKALEYFEKEFSCNKEKPVEQVKTLWEIAEILEKLNQTQKSEEIYLKAVSMAEKINNDRMLYNSMYKLLSFYEAVHKNSEAEILKRKLNDMTFNYESDNVSDNEDSPELFSDVNLSDLSDSDTNEDESLTKRSRTKSIQKKINEKGETPLHQACISGNLNTVKRLVENGHSLNVKDFAGWTPLHEACNFGYYEIAEYLVEKGANINDHGGPEHVTPLHDAASNGNLDIMALLISKGASVSAVDHSGDTPLQSLLKWKLQSNDDLDELTLRQFRAIELELKFQMTKSGIDVTNVDLIQNGTLNENNDRKSPNARCREKRARSPSLSPKIISDVDDDDDDNSPIIDNNYDWENSNNATAEYRSVMKNLRLSAATISPAKSTAPKLPKCPLIDEAEVVDEWLIKDTRDVYKTKRKKRKLAKLNVRTSKRIDDYLLPQESSENMYVDTNISIVDDDSNFSIASVDSAVQNAVTSLSNAVISDTSQVSFCLRVKIADKLILVPVPDDSNSIGWLMEEAAKRFQHLDGSKPYLTITKNGALLSNSDLIKDIFSNNEEIIANVSSWDESSLKNRYEQICAQQNVTPLFSVKKRLKSLESTAELNFSNCSMSPLHLTVIFSTISNFKNLQYLNISGVSVHDSNMNDFILCFPSFTMLKNLNMSCCSLTSECLKTLTNYLNSDSKNILPELKTLDLSFNSFSSSSCFLPLLNLSSLVSLNLSSCGLSSSLLLNPTFCNTLQNKYSLEELNLSGNFLGEEGISNLLKHLPKLSLKKLNLKHTLAEDAFLGSKIFQFFSEVLPFLNELILQGCFLNDIDVNQISLCLTYCPELKICDLSGNNLTFKSLCNFIDKAYNNCPNITDINITGTCVWEDEHFSFLKNLFNFNDLKHFCIDGCSENLFEKLIHSWQDKWGNRAVFHNFGFLDLGVV